MLLRRRLFFSPSLQYVSSGRRRLKFQTFAIKNASASSGRSGRARKVYTESQSEAAPSTSFPVKEIASSVLPVGSFIVVTFGIAFNRYIFLLRFLVYIVFECIASISYESRLIAHLNTIKFNYNNETKAGSV